MVPRQLFCLSLRQCVQKQPHRLSGPSTWAVRSFSKTPLSQYPRKGYEDKDSINAEATEYTKSGTDDAAARQDEAAFDPKTTDPEKEKEIAGEGNEKSGNPLDVSPANPEVSKQRGETEGGAENSPGEKRSSGEGSPAKNKKT